MSAVGRVALGLCLLFSASAQIPAPAKASIRGVVRDAATGLPIADAEVFGSSSSGGAEATTDSRGEFILTGLSFGQVQIRVFHFFLGGNITKVVTLEEGKTPA